MIALRRLHNRIDRWLDRASLAEPEQGAERLPGGGVPCLASHALEQAMAVARRLDRDARLKRIAAPQGTAADGAGRRWTLWFELPRRRAKLRCDWYLDGDTAAGRFGRECFDWQATPFPAADTTLARGVSEGRLAYASLATVWAQERRQRPDLPFAFRDSDAALSDLLRRGLDPAAGSFSLSSEAREGNALAWLAQAGEQAFRCRFD